MHTILATFFLTLVVLAPLVAGMVAIHRSPFTAPQTILFAGALLLARVLWRAKLPPRLPVSADQGAVLVSNHRSSVDPFFVQSCCRDRPTHWMVAREYCEHPLFGPLLRAVEVIPVGRGGVDTAAIRTAIRYLSRGGLVGMFPEGRINSTDEFMMPVRPGAVLVALKAGVPIIPMYIEGSPFGGTVWSPLLMPAKVRVDVGEPIELAQYADRVGEPGLVAEIIREVAKRIAHLAGRSDFEPKLAGRRWKPFELGQ